MTEEHVDVYGVSDDLIEIEGAIREEFSANYEESTTIHVGPYDVGVEYDGKWHMWVENTNDGYTIYDFDGDVSYKDYSQTLRIHDPDPEWSAWKGDSPDPTNCPESHGDWISYEANFCPNCGTDL